MIRAVFFDIDGTLMSLQTRTIPDGVFEALHALKEKGIRLFIATGRGKDRLKVLADFPFDGYITLNGQFCYDADGTVIYENTIDPRDIAKLDEILQEHPFPCGYVLRDTKVFNFRDERVDEVHAITGNDAHPAGDTSHMASKKVYQVMAFIDEAEEKQVLQKLTHCTAARWYPTFCDLSPLGGTKVKGIDRFLGYYDIPLREALSLGDGGNDYEMLKHTGYACAMGNAGDALKSIADFVTEDADHDGIRMALRHYGLL